MYKRGQVIVMFIEQLVKQLMSRAESDFCLIHGVSMRNKRSVEQNFSKFSYKNF